MQRTNIYLTDDQHASLDRLAGELGQTKAAVVRQLIDDALARRSADGFRRLLAETAGVWRDAADEDVPARADGDRQAYLDEVMGT